MLCRKRLRTIEIVIATFHIRQHNVLGKVAYNHVITISRRKSSILHVYQHIWIVQSFQVIVGQRGCAVPHNSRNRLCHLCSASDIFQRIRHRRSSANTQNTITIESGIYRFSQQRIKGSSSSSWININCMWCKYITTNTRFRTFTEYIVFLILTDIQWEESDCLLSGWAICIQSNRYTILIF